MLTVVLAESLMDGYLLGWKKYSDRGIVIFSNKVKNEFYT